MSGWKEILSILAKKLTPILAFAGLIVIVVALLGQMIPPAFRALIYIVVVGAMVIYAIPLIASTIKSQTKPPDNEKALHDYLSSIIADCNWLRLVGIDFQAADPGQKVGKLTLEDLYVSLDTTTPRKSDDEKEGGKKKRDPVGLGSNKLISNWLKSGSGCAWRAI